MEDREEYVRLRNTIRDQRLGSLDHRAGPLSHGIFRALQFVRRSPENQYIRAIVVGVCCVGRVACVNTSYLSHFLSRCKSSINGGFQELRYVPIVSIAKGRACLLAIMPPLQDYRETLRLWSVRVAAGNALMCFVSPLQNVAIPEITEDDIPYDLYFKPRKSTRNENPHTDQRELKCPASATEPPSAVPQSSEVEWATDITCLGDESVPDFGQDEDWPPVHDHAGVWSSGCFGNQ
jgi:hypothetical protein